MKVYDTLFDYGEFDSESGTSSPPDAISTSPYAVMAVWRYRYPVTFSRERSGSASNDISYATDLRDKVLIIVDDLSQLNIRHSKSTHIGQLNAVFNSGMNYMVEIFPGDWVAAWIVNDEHAMLDIVTRIQKGEAANKFSDGLKFLGKATSIRKRINVSGNGVLTSSYTFNAASFTEFDAQLYYEEYLASKTVGVATQWLRKTGKTINNIIHDNKGGIEVNKALPLFLNAFYGTGVPENESLGGDGSNSNTEGFDTANAFVVPDQVASVLGVTKGTKPNGKKGWADICETVMGIQRYGFGRENLEGLRVGKETPSGMGPEGIFTPDGVDGSADVRNRTTPQPMLGRFLPSAPQFNGQRTVWTILQQFLNPAVNEMFTCLRVNPAGYVFPTLVVRQLPFSSGILSSHYVPKPQPIANEPASESPHEGQHNTDGQGGGHGNVLSHNAPRHLVLTRFVELPRWKIHPILVRNVDLGRSDAMRWNFIHVYGDSGIENQRRSDYITRDPPIKDDLDIARGGLRPYMATVHCDPADAQNRKSGDWMYILSDILMGQHMLLTGTIDMLGLVSPICPGDNVEFDDHILHIETVTHNFSISGDGIKSFRTSLSLTHGVKATQMEGEDLSMVSGTEQKDLARFDHSTSESRLRRQTPSEPSAADDLFDTAPKIEE